MGNLDYDKAFRLFVSTEEHNNNYKLTEPFLQNGFYYATDCQVLITLPATEAKLDYKEQNSPEIDSIIPKTATHNVEINIAELEAKIGDINNNEKKTCTSCNGEGSVRCNLNHKHDCPKCFGTGEITNDSNKYKIYSICYEHKRLIPIIKACKILGIENIRRINGNKDKASFFTAGKVSFLIMPSFIFDEDKPIFIF